MDSELLNISRNITSNDILGGWSWEYKKSFVSDVLKSTGRKGISDAIDKIMNETDFSIAPSSIKHHSNYDGGLLDHVILVYATCISLSDMRNRMSPGCEPISYDSIAICSLLHDICKIGFYTKKEKYRKNAEDRWESYIGYEVSDVFPIGHGEKSVIMAQMYGIELTPEEMIAIRWHMAMWEAMPDNLARMSYSRAIDSNPLAVLIQEADYYASLLLETKI